MPSHCNINGNEIVDRAAKRGAMKNGIDIVIPNTKSEVASSRLIHYSKLWQTDWDHAEHGRFIYALHI